MSKNILIIGGNSEIGKHLGKLCHKDGYSLFVTSRSGQTEIEGTQIQCDPLGDLSVLDELPESLDGFVYCPGTINLKSLQRMTLDDLQNDMNINFFGAFNTFKHVLSKLKKDNGASAVFFSTVAAATVEKNTADAPLSFLSFESTCLKVLKAPKKFIFISFCKSSRVIRWRDFKLMVPGQYTNPSNDSGSSSKTDKSPNGSH